MPSATPRFTVPRLLLLVVLALGAFVFATAGAAPVPYIAVLDGVSEAPPNASPGTGNAAVDIDAVANTMHVHVDFTGLTGITTASHIHAPTAAPNTGTAGVATTTPYFAGFPIGVTAGIYDILLDMTLSTSYNGSYIAGNGGTTASAEAALFAAIAAGKAYLNVHSQTFPGGEIRGFLMPGATPTHKTSWGRVKSLYLSSTSSPSLEVVPALGLPGAGEGTVSVDCCMVP
jgi:hypothetical protein